MVSQTGPVNVPVNGVIFLATSRFSKDSTTLETWSTVGVSKVPVTGPWTQAQISDSSWAADLLRIIKKFENCHAKLLDGD